MQSQKLQVVQIHVYIYKVLVIGIRVFESLKFYCIFTISSPQSFHVIYTYPHFATRLSQYTLKVARF